MPPAALRNWDVNGAAVRARCYAQGLSLKQLADRSGLGYSHIKYIVNDQVKPYDHTLRKLVRVLGCRVEDIATPRTDGVKESAA